MSDQILTFTLEVLVRVQPRQIHHTPYSGRRLAIVLAIFANTFIGPMPTETGIPVHFLTVSLISLASSSGDARR